jgi:myo-inositol-1(or 4)-monophosphatase
LPAADLVSLRASLEALMREAGQLARATALRPFRRWTKGKDRSPVSEGDIAVNDFLRERLSRLVPQAGWVSEETADAAEARAQSLVWIVDPIDGTRAYIAGSEDWTISVALVDRGRPVLAALYAPVTDEMFSASRGHGATRNNARIEAKDDATLAGARLAGPRRTLDRMAAREPSIVPTPKIHSLALRFARVAQGELDAAFAGSGAHDWDLAAADLLLHEAGGVLTDVTGLPLNYANRPIEHEALIAAGPARHRTLLELMHGRLREFV